MTTPPRSGVDLVTSATRALLLFNVAGDPNPLHGLHGEPILDVVTGALLVLGVGVAFARWHRVELGAVVAWFIAAVIVAALVGVRGGTDSLAAVHALAPALLLAASALSATAGGLWRRGWPGGLAARPDVGSDRPDRRGERACALHPAPADATAWSAYGGPEALAAREIRSLASTHTVYLADVWIGDPTIRYLAQVFTAPRRLDPATSLPFPKDETFAYFSPGNQEVVPEDLERLYEDGEIDRFRSPLDESVVAVRSFRAPAKVVGEARGVTLPGDVHRTLARYSVHPGGFQS